MSTNTTHMQIGQRAAEAPMGINMETRLIDSLSVFMLSINFSYSAF